MKDSVKIGVCGCVAQQEGERILQRAPWVDFVMGPGNVGHLDAILAGGAKDKQHRAVIAEEGPMRGSVGAWLAWVIMEDCFDDLDAPVLRASRARLRQTDDASPAKASQRVGDCPIRS